MTHTQPAYIDAEAFGFSPEASGLDNRQALQQAVDAGGTVVVHRPGTYRLAGTVYLASDTALRFGHGVFVAKSDEAGPFMHVFLNKGALTRERDHRIAIEGLHLIVNGVDSHDFQVYGLRGHVAFFHVSDLRIERFRCLDFGRFQYCLQVCTFEDLLIRDVILKGQKDGIHLNGGKRFTITDGVFETYDDAIALNAHDYATGTPELGWIEDGVVERCIDLDAEQTTGFFCRLLAGAWCDWQAGMAVQQSDAVVADGRLYRVQSRADGQSYTSTTQPTHRCGEQVVDGITWGVVQDEPVYAVGVRNVTFRDITLHKARVGFAVMFDRNRHSRSYYPGATAPQQGPILLENVRVTHATAMNLVSISTPVNVLTVAHSQLRQNRVHLRVASELSDHGPTSINFVGCSFAHDGPMTLLTNDVPGKTVTLKTSASIALHDGFRATVEAGEGMVRWVSDLTGLTAEQ